MVNTLEGWANIILKPKPQFTLEELSAEIRAGYRVVTLLRRRRARSRIDNAAYIAAERELAQLKSIATEMGLAQESKKNDELRHNQQ